MLLLDYSKESGRISVRHFSILAQPSGVTKNLKALLARKKVGPAWRRRVALCRAVLCCVVQCWAPGAQVDKSAGGWHAVSTWLFSGRGDC